MDRPRRKLKKCCYVQPPVRESIKPSVKYQRSTIPFNDKTTSRSDYLPIDDETMRLLQADQELAKKSKADEMKTKYPYRSTIPFNDKTTSRLSYQPIDDETMRLLKADQELAKKSKAHLMKAKYPHLNANIKMDTDTIHNLSYQPVATKPKETPPWAKNAKYRRSQIPMDLNTIYEYSYRLPGKFVECGDDADKNIIVTYAENCEDIEGLIRLPDGPYKY
ncbi:stabilizer of axonemal microtubules 1-like [Contarinia nasturtii]|uniref:stabilizer of axonemal microtubules 1-like n=1 Tax=Contarinia nasturtii TaxID=265458 RepID=UPI0012D40E7B|nr:stabilizer of axonemal microtubules 1-like [Contarinia nasturtii]